jgi:Fe-S-cluster-containing dehydrogenase component/formate-dependent nitrite reductase membrane component NrfD
VTRLAFLLDSGNCIGCHACTVACKAEHDVPVGVNRTWVKYVERGTFPHVSRHFAVMRCNHCDDAPCVTICPTGALFRAPNGVVDFDDRSCIGCKGCLNACPYDAVYIDPTTSTAKKCNFCNHRVEAGLAPSCVIVCPTDAIKVGDLDDPESEVSRIVGRDSVAVRAPEQGTRPKVFYRGADQAALDPLRTAISPDGMIWAERTPAHPSVPEDADDVVARTAYTTAHPAPWGAKVSAYLVTKAVAAGMMLVAALLVLLGHGHDRPAVGVLAPVVAGVFLAVTGALLVADLKQPRRALYLLTRPNPSSWLVRGAWVLGAYAVALALWLLGGVVASSEVVAVVAAPTALLAAATAGYTAFLFGQCEGRDLWQTPALLPTLLAQAVTAGGAAFCVLDAFVEVPEPRAVRWCLLGGVLATAALVGVELASSGSRHVELAQREMVRGAVAGRFWWGGVVLGLAVPAVLCGAAIAADAAAAVPAVAGVAALAGMFAHEDAFVRAGQSVPLS